MSFIVVAVATVQFLCVCHLNSESMCRFGPMSATAQLFFLVLLVFGRHSIQEISVIGGWFGQCAMRIAVSVHQHAKNRAQCSCTSYTFLLSSSDLLMKNWWEILVEIFALSNDRRFIPSHSSAFVCFALHNFCDCIVTRSSEREIAEWKSKTVHGVYKNQFCDNDWIAVYVCVDAHMVMERKSLQIFMWFSVRLLPMLCIYDDQKM